MYPNCVGLDTLYRQMEREKKKERKKVRKKEREENVEKNRGKRKAAFIKLKRQTRNWLSI